MKLNLLATMLISFMTLTACNGQTGEDETEDKYAEMSIWTALPIPTNDNISADSLSTSPSDIREGRNR